ncbi:hypothetical protein KKF84_16080, partial [Myxococcota bacterium]|nr:hypothetical protein [Myxococcota bacterium]MBU1536845.1 hypothetical protein [Myxococcota bacterium]
MKRISLFLLVLCTIAGLFAAACDDDSNNENNINNVNNSNNTNNVNNLSCGNGLLDEGESCDGTNLNDQTCQSVGSTFNGGTLACNTNCTWDVSGCSTGEEVCGDGAVEGLEVC